MALEADGDLGRDGGQHRPVGVRFAGASAEPAEHHSSTAAATASERLIPFASALSSSLDARGVSTHDCTSRFFRLLLVAIALFIPYSPPYSRHGSLYLRFI